MQNYQNRLNPEKIRRFADNNERFKIDASGYFNQSWQMVQNDGGSYIGFAFISLFAATVVNMIPLIGGFFQMISAGLFDSGFSIYSHKKMNNEIHDFNDFFGGITNHLQPLLIYLVVYSLILFLLFSPIHILDISNLIIAPDLNINDTLSVIMGLSVFILLPIYIYFGVTFFFTPYFILFADMEPMEALKCSRKIVHNNFWSVFLLMFFGFLINILGVLVCCVGLLWSHPTVQVGYFLAFEDIFKLDSERDEMDEIIQHLL